MSQTMESRTLPQFIQVGDFPPEFTAVDKISEVDCGTDVNPCYGMESLQCDVLDPTMTVADCTFSENSLGTNCVVISATEIGSNSETCSGNFFNGSDSPFKEECSKQISLEAADVTPCGNNVPYEETRIQEKTLPLAMDPCSYVLTSAAGNMSAEAIKSVDNINLSSLATNQDHNDVEHVLDQCATHELAPDGVLQRYDCSTTNYFPFEVAHVMEITASVDEDCSEDMQCFGKAEKTVEPSDACESLFYTTTSDCVYLPCSCLEPYEEETKESSKHALQCHSCTLLPDLLVRPRVLQSGESETQSEVRNESVLVSASILSNFDGNIRSNTVLADDAVVQPLSREVNFKPKYEVNDCLGVKDNDFRFDTVVDNVRSSSVSESREINTKQLRKSDILKFKNYFDSDSMLHVTVAEDRCEVNVKPKENCDNGKICFSSKTDFIITNDVLAQPSSISVSPCNVVMNSEVKNDVLRVTDVASGFGSETRLDAMKSNGAEVQCSAENEIDDYSSFRNESVINAAIENDVLVRQPLCIGLHEIEVKSEKRSITDDFGCGDKLNNIISEDDVLQNSPILELMEIKPKAQSYVSLDHEYVGNNVDSEHICNAVIVEDAFLQPSPALKHHQIEIETKESKENLSPVRSPVENVNGSNKFVCSVFQNFGRDVVESDLELTKHLMQGLSFFTPVRDILKVHGLLSSSSRISESTHFSGFGGDGCSTISEHCYARTARGNLDDGLVEEHCGHLSVSNLYPSYQEGSVGLSFKKKCTRFGSITIYFFPRAQGFSTVASDSGVALGMELQHCDVKLLSLLDYAVQKDQPPHRGLHHKRKKKRMSSSLSVNLESHKPMQILPSHKRTSLLRAAGIRNVDQSAIEEAVMINASRLICGCFCTDGCQPTVCFCARMEIECLIEREGFPCGCTTENCGNPNGRTYFSPSKVHSHFVQTLVRLGNGEGLGKGSEVSPAPLEGDGLPPSLLESAAGPQFDGSDPPVSGRGRGLPMEPCVYAETFPISGVEIAYEV